MRYDHSNSNELTPQMEIAGHSEPNPNLFSKEFLVYGELTKVKLLLGVRATEHIISFGANLRM
jgi:hypothetical protein